MKKYVRIFILSVTLCFFCIEGYSQGMNVWRMPTNPISIYIGSLMKDKDSGANREKIKIEIFGADYRGSDLGTTTYSIATRFGYRINKERTGGSCTEDRFSLKIYERNDMFDVVVESNSWAAFIVKGWILDSNPMAHEVKCTQYDAIGKKDVTNLFTETTFLTSTASGNIGIGIENPKSKLEVNGTIRAKEVKIESTGWADFVFEPNYNLPPLDHVKKHIEEKKHLPDIPSATEVKENGVDLGEMQIKLLQKIEELTLYVIEQNEKIERQSIEIISLKEELMILNKN